jgi:hypothetical protein
MEIKSVDNILILKKDILSDDSLENRKDEGNGVTSTTRPNP